MFCVSSVVCPAASYALRVNDIFLTKKAGDRFGPPTHPASNGARMFNCSQTESVSLGMLKRGVACSTGPDERSWTHLRFHGK